MRLVACLLALLFLQACARTPEPQSQRGDGYVRATVDASANIAIELTAPAIHPLFLLNCNGQVTWSLIDRVKPAARVVAKDVVWGQETDLCMSNPIFIPPRRTYRFVGRVRHDEDAPPAGAYRVLVPNVTLDWTHPNPSAGVMRWRGTQVSHDLLTSDVIIIDN